MNIRSTNLVKEPCWSELGRTKCENVKKMEQSNRMLEIAGEGRRLRFAGGEGPRVKRPLEKKNQRNTSRRAGFEGRRPATRVRDPMTRAQPGPPTRLLVATRQRKQTRISSVPFRFRTNNLDLGWPFIGRHVATPQRASPLPHARPYARVAVRV